MAANPDGRSRKSVDAPPAPPQGTPVKKRTSKRIGLIEAVRRVKKAEQRSTKRPPIINEFGSGC